MGVAKRVAKRNPNLVGAARELLGFPVSKIGKTTEEDAQRLAESFHGRTADTKIELAERFNYQDKLAILGELESTEILCPDMRSIQDIRWKPNNLMSVSMAEDDRCVWLCAADEHQLECVDGDQSLEFTDDILNRLDISEEELDKQYVTVGPIYAIVYYTDKQHLQGPTKPSSYRHKFGEEKNGKLPNLVYDQLNETIMIVGGSYKITELGIKN